MLGGGWGYVALFVAAFALGGGVSGYVVYSMDTGTINGLKLAQSQAETKSVTTSLDQLRGFISKMQMADTNYSATLDAINSNFAGIKASIANVHVTVPLPPDCKPDPSRLRILSAAIDKTNGTISAVK